MEMESLGDLCVNITLFFIFGLFVWKASMFLETQKFFLNFFHIFRKSVARFSHITSMVYILDAIFSSVSEEPSEAEVANGSHKEDDQERTKHSKTNFAFFKQSRNTKESQWD